MRVIFTLALALSVSAVSAVTFPEIKSHPRLYADRQTFAMLKDRIQTDELVRLMADRVRANADKSLKSPLPKHGATNLSTAAPTTMAIGMVIGQDTPAAVTAASIGIMTPEVAAAVIPALAPDAPTRFRYSVPVMFPFFHCL